MSDTTPLGPALQACATYKTCSNAENLPIVSPTGSHARDRAQACATGNRLRDQAPSSINLPLHADATISQHDPMKR
jgi:hypothetical protein